MTASPYISRSSLSKISCPLQTAALGWWQRRAGVAELDEPFYQSLAPNFQIAMPTQGEIAPTFFFVGEQSLTAQILGNKFTPAMSAGEWWDDGGYAEAVSSIYIEVTETGEPSLEEIKAHIRLPGDAPIILNYQRMCLPTSFESGEATITVITRQKSILRVVN